MRQCHIAIVLAAAVAVSTLSPAFAAPPTPVKMYRDESRSLQLGIPLWKSIRLADGLFQTRVMDLIDGDRLSKYDVIVINNQVEGIAYTSDELDAIREFVGNGGGLLLIGTPSPYIEKHARFPANGTVRDLAPLPARAFSSNQVAAMFGVAFANFVRVETPDFNKADSLFDGDDFDTLAFKQPLGLLMCQGKVRPLVAFRNHPVVVAAKYKKGRVIVCGASRFFAVYGNLSDRKLGKTDTTINAQKQLFMKWLEWLAAGSPVREQSQRGYPDSIPGRVHLMGDQIEIFTIPQLQEQAEQLMSDWDKVWPAMASYLDVQSPLELIGVEPGTLLTVYLRAAPTGGLSGGVSISIPAMGGDERLIGILGHEVGHKLLGGCSTGMSEAFAEWLSVRALYAAGQDSFAQEKLDRHNGDFRKEDPSGTKLDIADRDTDIRQCKACQGKWMWILAQLSEKYGDDVLARYLKALRKNVALVKPAKKSVNGRERPLAMADHVRALSDAAGEDLSPWFRELGITIEGGSE